MNKHRMMAKVIKEADLPHDELVELLAVCLADKDPEKVSDWFREMKDRRRDLEHRMNSLLKDMKERELRRFDPVI